MKKIIAPILLSALIIPCSLGAFFLEKPASIKAEENETSKQLSSNGESVSISVLNWADYIYKENDTDNEEKVTNERFNAWLKEKYPDFGEVKVLYSTSDTNESMINEFETGKADYDLLCPSDYGIQNLARKEKLLNIKSLMADYDLTNYENFASRAIRDYMRSIKTKTSEGTEYIIDEYAVGYMWGTLGILFNPEYDLYEGKITPEQVIEDMQSFNAFWDQKYHGTVTAKDSMRDTYFFGECKAFDSELEAYKIAYQNKEITKEEYGTLLHDRLNSKDQESIDKVKTELDALKSNIFGLEVDQGKQDIVTGKIGVNLAWSGDAVYSMDLADEDNAKTGKEVKYGLCYGVPENGANLWFDGWVLPKSDKRSEKQLQAALLFLDFMCDPVSATENMSYIGYTSFIGGDSILEYARDCYDIRCDLIYVLVDEENEDYASIFYYDSENKLTEVWFNDCQYEEDQDPEMNDVPLYYGHGEYDEEGNLTGVPDIEPLGQNYNERLKLDKEWEVVDLEWFFKDSLSSEYGPEDYIFYSDCYLPFTNEDGSKNISVGRQFFGQYPDEATIDRLAVMEDFGDANTAVLRMWEAFKSNTIYTWIIVVISIECGIIVIGLVWFYVRKHQVNKIKTKRREENASLK